MPLVAACMVNWDGFGNVKNVGASVPEKFRNIYIYIYTFLSQVFFPNTLAQLLIRWLLYCNLLYVFFFCPSHNVLYSAHDALGDARCVQRPE
jgi:hypothetical protein